MSIQWNVPVRAKLNSGRMSDALGKVYTEGKTVIRQGENGNCMFIILEGEAEVIRTLNGRDLTVARLRKGDIFGEMALIRKQARSATVRAATRLRVMTVDSRTFLQRVQEDPSIAMNLLRMLTERIEMLDEALTRAQPESERHQTEWMI